MAKLITTKQKHVSWIVVAPTIISVITAVCSLCYSRFSSRQMMDPNLTFKRIDDVTIQLLHRNDNVQVDQCVFYFPPYADSVDYVNSLMLNHRMKIDMNAFPYFSLLASNNDLKENDVFSIPFIIDLYYHYLNDAIHLYSLSHLSLCHKNGQIVFIDWQIGKVKMKRIKKRIINYDLPIDKNDYRLIEEWKYTKE